MWYRSNFHAVKIITCVHKQMRESHHLTLKRLSFTPNGLMRLYGGLWLLLKMPFWIAERVYVHPPMTYLKSPSIFLRSIAPAGWPHTNIAWMAIILKRLMKNASFSSLGMSCISTLWSSSTILKYLQTNFAIHGNKSLNISPCSLKAQKVTILRLSVHIIGLSKPCEFLTPMDTSIINMFSIFRCVSFKNRMRQKSKPWWNFSYGLRLDFSYTLWNVVTLRHHNRIMIQEPVQVVAIFKYILTKAVKPSQKTSNKFLKE